jgi:hypothetical protein
MKNQLIAFLTDKTKNIKMPKMPQVTGAKKDGVAEQNSAREESKKESAASFSQQKSGMAASFAS